MTTRIVKSPISKKELEEIAKNQFGDLVKAVVDVDRNIMAIGGELHADEETHLIENGSLQENLWGINLRLDKTKKDWIEFNSMINVRPSRGNRSRGVEDLNVRAKIIEIAEKLIFE